MLIDYTIVPKGIVPRSKVEALNAVHERLSARLVDQIKLPEAISLFRASNMIRVYLQCHLRRMLQLTEAAFSEFFDGRGVAAIMCARGLYEGLATVTDFEKELMTLLAGGDLAAIFQFTKERANATKIKSWIAKVGNPNVTAKNILTMVSKLKSVRGRIPDEYDFLSEIAHPNGAGALTFFCRHERCSE